MSIVNRYRCLRMVLTYQIYVNIKSYDEPLTWDLMKAFISESNNNQMDIQKEP